MEDDVGDEEDAPDHADQNIQSSPHQINLRADAARPDSQLVEGTRRCHCLRHLAQLVARSGDGGLKHWRIASKPQGVVVDELYLVEVKSFLDGRGGIEATGAFSEVVGEDLSSENGIFGGTVLVDLCVEGE